MVYEFLPHSKESLISLSLYQSSPRPSPTYFSRFISAIITSLHTSTEYDCSMFPSHCIPRHQFPTVMLTVMHSRPRSNSIFKLSLPDSPRQKQPPPFEIRQMQNLKLGCHCICVTLDTLLNISKLQFSISKTRIAFTS